MSQVQEPAAEYARRKSASPETPGLFGPTLKKGVVTDSERLPTQADAPTV